MTSSCARRIATAMADAIMARVHAEEASVEAHASGVCAHWLVVAMGCATSLYAVCANLATPEKIAHSKCAHTHVLTTDIVTMAHVTVDLVLLVLIARFNLARMIVTLTAIASNSPANAERVGLDTIVPCRCVQKIVLAMGHVTMAVAYALPSGRAQIAHSHSVSKTAQTKVHASMANAGAILALVVKIVRCRHALAIVVATAGATMASACAIHASVASIAPYTCILRSKYQ